jgi:hypothetical protein
MVIQFKILIHKVKKKKIRPCLDCSTFFVLSPFLSHLSNRFQCLHVKIGKKEGRRKGERLRGRMEGRKPQAHPSVYKGGTDAHAIKMEGN